MIITDVAVPRFAALDGRHGTACLYLNEIIESCNEEQTSYHDGTRGTLTTDTAGFEARDDHDGAGENHVESRDVVDVMRSRAKELWPAANIEDAVMQHQPRGDDIVSLPSYW